MTNIIWEEIIKHFGLIASEEDKVKGFANMVIPLDNDVLIIEEKGINTEIKIADELSVLNIQEKEKEKDCENLLVEWKNYYKEIVSPAIKNLKYTEENINHEDKRVHKLLILKGIDEITKQYYSTNFGGLVFNSGVKENSIGDVYVDLNYGLVDKKTKDIVSLFTYGNYANNLHIITDEQLNFITSYIPTLQGIVDYLSWKEMIFTKHQLISTDEYTLIVTYIQQLFKGKSEFNSIVPFEDIQIVDFVKSELSNELMNSTLIFKEVIDYMGKNDVFKQYFILLTLKNQLSVTKQFVDVLNIKYEEYSSKTGMLYQGRNLYILHNADSRIADEQYRKVYSGHFISKVALTYLTELKNEIEINNIICSIMHVDSNENTYMTFIAINVNDIISNEKNLDEIKELAAEGELVGWLPKTIELGQLIEQKKQEIKESIPEQKGTDRNKPCPCGSGKKYKKCCGKLR